MGVLMNATPTLMMGSKVIANIGVCEVMIAFVVVVVVVVNVVTAIMSAMLVWVYW